MAAMALPPSATRNIEDVHSDLSMFSFDTITEDMEFSDLIIPTPSITTAVDTTPQELITPHPLTSTPYSLILKLDQLSQVQCVLHL